MKNDNRFTGQTADSTGTNDATGTNNAIRSNDAIGTNTARTNDAAGTVGTGKSKIIMTACLYTLILTYALSVTMVAPMLSILIKQYDLRLSQGGLVVVFQSIGGMLAIVLGGILADLVKKSRLIGAGFGLYSAALFIISLAPPYQALLGMFFILGAGTRLVDTVTNAYIADLHPNQRGLFVNLLHMFFGIGALLGPLYSRFLLDRGILWNRAFSLLGAACTVVLLLYVIILRALPAVQESKSAPKLKDFATVITSPGIWILCLVMFMYAGHQSGVNVWIIMYMETYLKAPPFLCSLALSIFWVGIILGRFICSQLSQKFQAKYLIQWGSLLGGSLLVGGIVSHNPIALVAAIGAAGLFTGATIPMLVVIACSWFPQNSGTASSMIFLSSSTAWIAFPWLIGNVAEFIGFEWGVLATGTNLLLVFLTALLIPVQRTK